MLIANVPTKSAATIGEARAYQKKSPLLSLIELAIASMATITFWISVTMPLLLPASVCAAISMKNQTRQS